MVILLNIVLLTPRKKREAVWEFPIKENPGVYRDCLGLERRPHWPKLSERERESRTRRRVAVMRLTEAERAISESAGGGRRGRKEEKEYPDLRQKIPLTSLLSPFPRVCPGTHINSLPRTPTQSRPALSCPSICVLLARFLPSLSSLPISLRRCSVGTTGKVSIRNLPAHCVLPIECTIVYAWPLCY